MKHLENFINFENLEEKSEYSKKSKKRTKKLVNSEIEDEIRNFGFKRKNKKKK